MSQNFKLYSQYYDLLYAEKDYPAEANYIISLLNEFSEGGTSILELGSGTGIHAQLLSESGYRLIGLERSEDMVNIANAKALKNVSFKLADITDFKIDQTFDSVISLFHVISYITDSKHLLDTFKNICEHLKVNGIFIFDVWHSEAVHHQIPEKRTRTLANDSISIIRNAIPVIYPEKNVVEVNYEIEIKDLSTLQIQKFEEKHPMRHFSTAEMEILAYASGFEIIHSEEFLSKKQPSADTWGVCYILKRTKDV